MGQRKHTPYYTKATRKSIPEESSYPAFDQLDGSHPWQEAVPGGFLLYPVRELRKGRVNYFNFALAREMGLIPQDHPEKITPQLEKKILETFSIQIINEYDQINRRRFDKGLIKQRRYMATRYLQLQHKSRTGLTSGDGRSIWNGVVRHRGKTWDVSSRGTGVTRLAPGVVSTGVFLQTGQESIGYGCGLAEMDELLGAAIMSEIFHRQGIPTERVLTIIDLGKGFGIGVRAGLNLIRPAHLFSYIKQGDLENLKRASDYLIERQCSNKEWTFNSQSPRRYEYMLQEICRTFADFSARLDVDYVFAWMDWDGDNILANAGIIDYGSIRQFGLRHDEYRYDDDDRFSTNLNEQRIKARLIVQVFAQIVNAITHGKKRPLEEFSKHPILKEFDKIFEDSRLNYLLQQIGLTSDQSEALIENNKSLVMQFYREFKYFERMKTSGKPVKLPDGINRPALFCMRDLLRELPGLYSGLPWEWTAEPKDLFSIMQSTYGTREDKVFRAQHHNHLMRFQKFYKALIEKAAGEIPRSRFMERLKFRASIINRDDRMTGNSIALAVEEILIHQKRGLPLSQIQGIVDRLVQSQVLVPENGFENASLILQKTRKPTKRVLQSVLTLLKTYREDI